MNQLDANAVLSLGGWHSRDAEVLVIATHGDIAVALVDSNGDGNGVELDELVRDADGNWTDRSSGGADDDGVAWSPEHDLDLGPRRSGRLEHA
jgi:hypothetical protein